MDKEEEVSPSEPEPAMVCDWLREPEPERLFKDPDIKRLHGHDRYTGMQKRRLTYLAVRLSGADPFLRAAHILLWKQHENNTEIITLFSRLRMGVSTYNFILGAYKYETVPQKQIREILNGMSDFQGTYGA
jgi:hypothetical protein